MRHFWLPVFLIAASHLSAYSDPFPAKNAHLVLPLPELGGCKRPEQGDRGQRGPKGPQGSPFVPSFLSVYINGDCDNDCTSVPSHTAVLFNDFAIPTQGPAITYDPTTGTVTFTTTGFFEVNYGMVIDPLPNATLALQMNPAGVYSGTPGFATGSGLVPGSEITHASQDRMIRVAVIVHVTEVNQTMQLVNGNTPATDDVSMDTQTGGTLLQPILAYLTVKLLQ